MEDNVARIAESLRRITREGGDGNFVIFLVDEAKNYYVQFGASRGDTELRGEAVSNEYLEPEFALSERQIRQLSSLGWQYDPHESPNFYRDWEVKNDDDRLAVAQDVMRMLTQVYGLSPDQEFTIEINLE